MKENSVLVPRMSMASGKAPRMGRNKPPTMPGPKISSKSSLPLDRYVAALNIKNPYTMIRNKFPTTVVVHGKNPYVCSHVDSPPNVGSRSRPCRNSQEPSRIPSETGSDDDEEEEAVNMRPWAWPQRIRTVRKRKMWREEKERFIGYLKNQSLEWIMGFGFGLWLSGASGW